MQGLPGLQLDSDKISVGRSRVAVAKFRLRLSRKVPTPTVAR